MAPGFIAQKPTYSYIKHLYGFFSRGPWPGPGRYKGVRDPQQPAGTSGPPGRTEHGVQREEGRGKVAARAPSKNQQLLEGGREHKIPLKP